MKTIINLTPRPVGIVSDSIAQTIPPSGQVARIYHKRRQLKEKIGWIPVATLGPEIDKISGLPGAQDGVIYIVSPLVCASLPERTDLFCVDTGNAVRGGSGVLVVGGLIRVIGDKHELYKEAD